VCTRLSLSLSSSSSYLAVAREKEESGKEGDIIDRVINMRLILKRVQSASLASGRYLADRDGESSRKRRRRWRSDTF